MTWLDSSRLELHLKVLEILYNHETFRWYIFKQRVHIASRLVAMTVLTHSQTPATWEGTAQETQKSKTGSEMQLHNSQEILDNI